MTALYLSFSLLAALAFYLGCSHQRLWAGARRAPARWRAAGWLCCVLALASAIRLLGVWAGVFAALSALMLALVVLPYADGWRQLQRERGDVG